MRQKRLHTKLKKFLIEVGTKEGYTSYSGDSECLDVRFKRKHIEYKPDVIWKRKTACHAFEIAFTEDWRAIVGEFTLAWLAGCSSFNLYRLITYEREKDAKYGAMPTCDEYDFVSKVLKFLGGRFGLKWRLSPIFWNRLAEPHPHIADIRTELLWLKEEKMISEETYRSYFP